MAGNGKTGDEPRALPWAGMKQAVGLKTAGGPMLLRPHTATGTYGLIPSSKHDPGQAGQGSGTHSGCVLRSAFTRWSAPLPLPTTGYPLATLRVGSGCSWENVRACSALAGTQSRMGCRATPLLEPGPRSESGVAAALCHRSPKLRRPAAELRVCSTDSVG